MSRTLGREEAEPKLRAARKQRLRDTHQSIAFSVHLGLLATETEILAAQLSGMKDSYTLYAYLLMNVGANLFPFHPESFLFLASTFFHR